MHLWEKIIIGTIITIFLCFVLYVGIWAIPNEVKCSNECATQQDMPHGDFHSFYDECKCENMLFSFPHDGWKNIYE